MAGLISAVPDAQRATPIARRRRCQPPSVSSNSVASRGVTLAAPREAALPSEVHRLRVAVRGDDSTRGLGEILRALKSDPHRMLQSTGLWIRREHARRPDLNRVVHGLLRPGNRSAVREPIE